MVMNWRGETRVADEVRVMTVVEARDGRKITVDYRMIERRGRWLVRDVVVEGVSTIENYRSQFKRVLRQGDYAGLVAQLRAKLGEETLMFAQASLPPSASSATKPAETVAAVRPASPRATPARVTSPRVATLARPAAPVKAIAPAAVVKPTVIPAPKTVPSVVAKSTPVAGHVAMATVTKPRALTVDRAAIAPAVPPAADVLSPVGVVDITTHLLPSALLIMLGFGGVSGVVFLRRRASSSPLVLKRLGDGDKRLVLLHPVPGVAKVRESRRKRRVVPAPRNPARHVDDAHGA
jgi:hypothetical protein